MITFTDAETTFQVVEKKLDPSPFNPKNSLVSLGWLNETEEQYVCLYHNQEPSTPNARQMIQDMLDNTTLLVAHNLKFDLEWLYSCEFTYDKPVFCTMVAQYLLQEGSKAPLDLDSCLEAHSLNIQKDDRIDNYIKNKISFEDIPWDIVQSYGQQDVRVLMELFLSQMKAFNLSTKQYLKLAASYQSTVITLVDHHLASLQEKKKS